MRGGVLTAVWGGVLTDASRMRGSAVRVAALLWGCHTSSWMALRFGRDRLAASSASPVRLLD